MLIDTSELSRRTGCTARQIHSWSEKGIIPVAKQEGKKGKLWFESSIVSKVTFLMHMSYELRHMRLGILSDFYDEGMLDLGEGVLLIWGKDR